jgi:cytochrome c-type protein NapC
VDLVPPKLGALATFLRRSIGRSATLYPFLSVLGLFTGGVMFWGAFNWSLAVFNTESFCISCHEMSKNIYPEYVQSAHYLNDSGVRATCPDCHVPRNWVDMVIRKVGATNELYHKVVGSIDTREKFLEKRMELAEVVWESMESNNSLECRNCHELTFMDDARAALNPAHERAKSQGTTCIVCHMGIAHELPEEFFDVVHTRFEEDEAQCGNCHAQLNQTSWE